MRLRKAENRRNRSSCWHWRAGNDSGKGRFAEVFRCRTLFDRRVRIETYQHCGGIYRRAVAPCLIAG